MLKIIATVNNRRTLILGLDRENTTRLHEGKPIAIDLQAMLAQPKDQGASVQDVIICAGETLEEVHADLSQFLALPPFERVRGSDD